MPDAITPPLLHWAENDQQCTAHWRSESGLAPPKRVIIADDTLNADSAYRLACEGTGLLWRGDFQNARQLLTALARRIDRPPKKPKKAPAATAEPATAFHLHRQAQAQRARVLAMLLLPFEADYRIPLRRAPDVKLACNETWGAGREPFVASLRELLGVIGAHEWRKNGVEMPALGARIHPHYGVFSPLRGEYVELVAAAPLPQRRAGVRHRHRQRRAGGRAGAARRAARGGHRAGAARAVLRARELCAARCDGAGRAGAGRPVPARARAAGGVQSAVAAGAPQLHHRTRDLRSGQPHAARLPRRPGGASGAGRRRLAACCRTWPSISACARARNCCNGSRPAASRCWAATIPGRSIRKPPIAGDPLHAARAAEVTSLWRLARR